MKKGITTVPTHFTKPTIQNDQLASCMAERRLWAEVLQQTYYRATIGEGTAINFFKAKDGVFSTLCGLMNLPESLIREHVVRKAITALQQKRQKES
jgi:hypothetical protein